MFWQKKQRGRTAEGLPQQDELKEALTRPGRQVDLIFSTDIDRDMLDVRPSLVHDVSKKGHLILAQTFPRVNRSRVKDKVEVTFLHHDDEEGDIRVGYKATILGVLSDYKLSDRLREDVIVVNGPSRLERSTLRLHYRLAPPKEKDLRLYLLPEKTKVSVIDISAGGVKFSHPPFWSFSKGQEVALAIASGDITVGVVGAVVRSSDTRGGGRNGVTAVRFVSMDAKRSKQLTRIVNALSRHELAKRSGLQRK